MLILRCTSKVFKEIGLSASGKTTIGKKLFSRLKKSDRKCVFLDGDIFREMMGQDLGHTVKDRRTNADRLTNLCKFLDSYGIDVVACILSIFHDNQRYNRETFSEYKEVYIDAKMDKLIERDKNGLYEGAKKGEIKNVVGVDIDFVPPLAPDLIIDNNTDNPNFDLIIDKIIKKLDLDKKFNINLTAE